MAEQIISPGVFTRENDLSYLPQGIGQIGAAIIGPTVKGPAFVPTVVNSFGEYTDKFGDLSSETFVPQTVREYLASAGSVTVCRVLAGGGYTFANGTNEYFVIAASSASFATPAAQISRPLILSGIFPTKNAGVPDLGGTTIESVNAASEATMGGPEGSGSFNVVIAGSNITTTQYSASIDPSAGNYLPDLLGYKASVSQTGPTTFSGSAGYAYVNFESLQTSIIGKHGYEEDATSTPFTGYGTVSGSNGITDIVGYLGTGSFVIAVTQSADATFNGNLGQTEGYSYASTPFITSQLQGATGTSLFKFHSIAHGTSCNHDYKVSISNLKEPADIDGVKQYSTFTVTLRKFSDIDKSPVVIEQYTTVNLDPMSPNYICRRIGDKYPQYNDTLDKVEILGFYSNISKYIRVEVTDAIANKATSPKLSPKGFKALYNPIATASLSYNCVFPSSSYEDTQQVGTQYSSKGYLGWKFDDKEKDNENWIRPLPTTLEVNCTGDFNVEKYNAHPSLYPKWTGSLSASITSDGILGPTGNELKFTVPFQGGEDGLRPDIPKFVGNETTLAAAYTSGDNLYGFDINQTSAAGYTGYKKAIDILSNQDEYDINMIAVPGIIHSIHPLVTNYTIDMVEDRGDCFFVMDLARVDATVNTAVSKADGLDTNYAAVYYPWVKVLDSSTNRPILVPPSVIVPGAIAQSDEIGAEWFAPAGLNRGILGTVIEARIRLNQAERDSLYNAKINPIATFPGIGNPCIWGQKTLQSRSTALDRINVRRLLIALKKFIASSSKYLVFEQNTTATRNRFLNIVNPYLESVQSRQGLYAFRVQMDEGNNTPDVIDRNQLVGGIYLQPTKTAEFIILDFNVLPTGATFDGGGGGGSY